MDWPINLWQPTRLLKSMKPNKSFDLTPEVVMVQRDLGIFIPDDEVPVFVNGGCMSDREDITPKPEILAQLLKKAERSIELQKPPPNHMKPNWRQAQVIIDW